MSCYLRATVVLAIAGTVMLAPHGHLAAAPPIRRPAPEGPTIVRLAIDPAAEPRPALKYTFLTPQSARKPGNAAPFYYRAIIAYAIYRPAIDRQFDEWARTPLDELPRDEMRRLVNGFGGYDDLHEAARRERCDWDYQLQNVDGLKSLEFHLTEVQDSRGLARFLAAKARLEIAEGRYADAVETMGVGFQFARDLSTAPLIICRLVGIAIGGVLDDQAHAFFAAPQSPNLYWAFTELPRPFIDMRPAVEFDLTLPERVFPMLKDPEHAQHSPEQWADIVSHAYFTLSTALSDRPAAKTYGWESRLAATGLALRGYTQAKRDLIAAGYDAAKIEQMPVGQVIAVDEAYLTHYIADEIRKWTLVPYAEGGRRTDEVTRKLVHDHYLGPELSSREVLPINDLLLPGTASAMEASNRRDV
ncbi:MAG TPA: hypothetical protein VHX68_10680, partial [Planctomycetaceae bacterium]|nr:hypothetical protein [Planctomycetaceae bacterium]